MNGMLWVHCRLTLLFFCILWIKIEYYWVFQDVWLTAATRRGRLLPFSQLAALWGLLWVTVVWSKTHLCDSTFFRNTGWRAAKALWAVTEWTGAWASATLTSLCQCPGLFFKDQELCGMILEFHCNEWAFVFKWGCYFSSREQILLLFVLFLFK